jgi:hypothetical protein
VNVDEMPAAQQPAPPGDVALHGGDPPPTSLPSDDDSGWSSGDSSSASPDTSAPS